MKAPNEIYLFQSKSDGNVGVAHHEHPVETEKLTRIAKVAYQKGREEALKDLPRWGSNLKSSMVDGADVIGQWLYYKEHRIRISDLEKLPGFKEDESHE